MNGFELDAPSKKGVPRLGADVVQVAHDARAIIFRTCCIHT